MTLPMLGFVRRLLYLDINFKLTVNIRRLLDFSQKSTKDCRVRQKHERYPSPRIVMLAVLGFNAMGDAIRDILDPRMLSRVRGGRTT
jgi:hypothetical protein